jgi:hypothetical protein
MTVKKRNIDKRVPESRKSTRELEERMNDETLDEGLLDQDDQEVEGLLDDSDAIEVEEREADRITFGMNFNPKEGDLGDESEDRGDLPENLTQNRYDPTLSTRPSGSEDPDEIIRKIRITNENNAGLGYGDNDYSDEE